MVATENRWRRAAVIAVLVLGTIAGQIHGASRAAVVQVVTDEVNQQLFDAIDQWLKAAGVKGLDLPEKVLEVTVLGPEHYKVHMKMVEGDAWFEVRRKGGRWEVKGLPPQAK